MTKMKSRKMTKSTFAIIIMGIAMVAMLAFGGTFAYFTASTTEVTSTATTGTIKLGANSIGTLTAHVVSGEQVLGEDQKVSVTNASNRGAWIFITFTAELLNNAEPAVATGNLVADLAHITNEGDYWLDYGVANTWSEVRGVALAGSTETEIRGVYAMHISDADLEDENYEAEKVVCDSIRFYGKSNSTVAEAGSLMGMNLKLTITSEAIQDVLEVSGSNGTAITTAVAAYKALKGAAVDDYVAPVNP